MGSIAPLYKRIAFLKRNPRHSQKAYSAHYEQVHGPLASSLAGFRKYVTRYTQNHVEHLGGEEAPFDGVSIMAQVPRPDYTVGFVTEPDCKEKLRPDEIYLFDLERSIAVLAREDDAGIGLQSPHKALVLGGFDTLNTLQLDGVTKRVLNYLDPTTAVHLNREAAAFPYSLLAEVWFEHEEARGEAAAILEGADIIASQLFLPVRELLMLGPDKSEGR